jgi:hypothetical protein
LIQPVVARPPRDVIFGLGLRRRRWLPCALIPGACQLGLGTVDAVRVAGLTAAPCPGSSPSEELRCVLSGLGFAAGRWRLLLTARSERRDDRRLAVDVPYTRLGSWRANGFIRPVLKHGPRSLTCARVSECQTLGRNESEG